MASTLSRSTRNKIASLHAQVKALVRGDTKRTPATLRQIKQAGRKTLAGVIKLNRKFAPVDPVERALADKVRKSPKARAGVRAILTKSKATPADYYELLHKIVGDSKLLGMHKPAMVHKLFRQQRGGMAPAGCECSACEACMLCSICEASVVEGMGTTGLAGMVVSTAVGNGNGS